MMDVDAELMNAQCDDAPNTPARLGSPRTPRVSTTKLAAPPGIRHNSGDVIMPHADVFGKVDNRGDAVPLCLDQADWLEHMVRKYGLFGVSDAVSRLVIRANAEPTKAKKANLSHCPLPSMFATHSWG